jgi:glycosyltransferase involved in cell wall biosynthesis
MSKIFHILPQFHFVNDRTIIGGYPSAVGRLAVAQAGQGSTVEIVARMPKLSVSLFAGVRLSNLEIVDATSHRHPFRFARKLFKFLKPRLNSGDILHFHSGHAEYALVSAYVALFFKRRVVHTLYCPLRGGPRGLAQRTALMFARSCGVSFTGMSKHVCTTIPGQSTWTPPVIDTQYLDPGRIEPDGRTAGDCLLLFVGNATPSKGLADLLPAFGRVVDLSSTGAHLRLVATTELARTGERTELRDVMDSLSTEAASKVEWRSIVPDMRELVRTSDIHVAPFRSTNGPSDYFIATLEAMSMGKVCIVSDLPGMAEVIRDGENGFSFRAGDVLELENALKRAINCDRIAVGRSARHFVVETCGDSAINTTNSLYGGLNG